MSSISEEDESGPSLKELVTRNLETRGILGNLQAQLRASIFLILEDEFKEKNIPLINEKTHELLSSPVGKIAVSLIQDFLQCLNLEFTLSVFCPESKSDLTEKSQNRQDLSKEFGSCVNDIKDKNNNHPLLFSLIEKSWNHQNISQHMKTVSESNNVTSCVNREGGRSKDCDTEVSSSPLSNLIISSPNVNVHASKHPSMNSSEGDPKNASLKKQVESENSKSDGDEREKSALLGESSASSKSHQNSGSKESNPSVYSEELNSSSSEISTSKQASETKLDSDEFSSESNTISSPSMKEEKEVEVKEEGTLPNVKMKPADELLKNTITDEKVQKVDTQADESEVDDSTENIDEDLSFDDLLSSNSGESNQTRDVTLSKENSVPDYEETL